MPKKLNRKKLTKVLQFFAAYLVAAWTLLQFVDWVLIRYSISPYWVDLLLWVFIGIIPSLIIYLYHQERINNRILILREKIIFPLNIVLIMVVTYFGFGTSDLGATTKEISYTNAAGELETQVITKEEFRVGVPIFNFMQVTQDSTTLWMSNIINHLLFLDLEQDKNVSPIAQFASSTTSKVTNSSIFNNYYVDGEFDIVDGLYKITPVIRNSKNGRELHRQTFSGADFFTLLDDISIYIRENIGIIKEQQNKYIDLTVKEFTTTSLAALEQFEKGYYEKAVEIDETFALAYYYNAKFRINYSQGTLEEQYLIDKAYKYRQRLPLQKQLQVLIDKHRAYNFWSEAEELIKLQLEIDPNNQDYQELLFKIYAETMNIDAYFKLAKSLFLKKENGFTSHYYGEALLLIGDYTAYINSVNQFELQNPNNNNFFPYKTFPLLLSGNLKAAAENQRKTKIVHPDALFFNVYDEAIAYQSNNTNKNVSKFTGTYRNIDNEMKFKYFKDNEKLIMQVDNQSMYQVAVAGENVLIKALLDQGQSTRQEFQKNATGNIYRIKITETHFDKAFDYYLYKEDELIKKAYDLLKDNNLNDAESAFLEAIAKNPDHWYLKDALAYVNYVKNTDSLVLKKQLEAISGHYGNRKFWTENNKLFYKRDNLPRMELMPISETRYLTLSRYNANFGFEFIDDNTIASFVWDYNIEKMEWVKSKNEDNYLLKNQ